MTRFIYRKSIFSRRLLFVRVAVKKELSVYNPHTLQRLHEKMQFLQFVLIVFHFYGERISRVRDVKVPIRRFKSARIFIVIYKSMRFINV